MARDTDWTQPYASRRSPVFARAVVATSQPLATRAGLAMLERGGNAVDAALAAAIALTVVEPTNNGVGSDAFAIVRHSDQLHGLNASGRSPAAFTPERFAGLSSMPGFGWDSVSVPGAVSAWVALSQRFGALAFGELFGPAFAYARDGFPISPVVAQQWETTASLYGAFPDFGATFLPGGRAPRPGEIFRNPDLAATLEEIAASRGESFYRGRLGAQIAHAARDAGGAMTEADLAEHRADWVDPVATGFAGANVHELPPNTQGLAALVALGILERLDLPGDPDDGETLHLAIEATKVGLAVARAAIGDPAAMKHAPEHWLEPARLDAWASRIDRRRAQPLEHAVPSTGDTVYLCAADGEGRAISYIQSNYFGFGSGIVVPGTGISLQNRASGFTLEPGHPNQVGPRKRPFHTLIPGFLTGGALGPFGVMGGPMQAQGHVQVVLRMLRYGQNPQAAADAPRWQVLDGLDVGVEPALSSDAHATLTERGHRLCDLHPLMFGGAQIIQRAGDVWCGASEPRKDGMAAGI